MLNVNVYSNLNAYKIQSAEHGHWPMQARDFLHFHLCALQNISVACGLVKDIVDRYLIFHWVQIYDLSNTETNKTLWLFCYVNFASCLFQLSNIVTRDLPGGKRILIIILEPNIWLLVKPLRHITTFFLLNISPKLNYKFSLLFTCLYLAIGAY